MTSPLPPDEFEQALNQILAKNQTEIREILAPHVRGETLDSVVAQIVRVMTEAVGEAGDKKEKTRMRAVRARRDQP